MTYQFNPVTRSYHIKNHKKGRLFMKASAQRPLDFGKRITITIYR